MTPWTLERSTVNESFRGEISRDGDQLIFRYHYQLDHADRPPTELDSSLKLRQQVDDQIVQRTFFDLDADK